MAIAWGCPPPHPQGWFLLNPSCPLTSHTQRAPGRKQGVFLLFSDSGFQIGHPRHWTLPQPLGDLGEPAGLAPPGWVGSGCGSSLAHSRCTAGCRPAQSIKELLGWPVKAVVLSQAEEVGKCGRGLPSAHSALRLLPHCHAEHRGLLFKPASLAWVFRAAAGYGSLTANLHPPLFLITLVLLIFYKLRFLVCV